MIASILLMKLKDRVVVVWFTALLEDPEGDSSCSTYDTV